MIALKKSVISSTLIILILINLVISQQTIQVQQQQTQEKEGFFSKYLGFLLSPLFWGIVIFIAFGILIVIGIFFLIKWLIKFIKNQNDIYYRLKNDRIKLSKIQKSYPSKHFWKVNKNIPIRLVKRNQLGKISVSDIIGYHRGDYTSHEGNIIISLNLKDKKKWFVFPITDILVIPDREKIIINQIKKNKADDTLITIDNLPRARDIIQFNSNEILIFAESLSFSGLFLTPVLRTEDNKIMDLSIPVYHTLREAVLNDYMYEQVNSFAVLSKKATEINPYLRSITKLQDASQNVDVTTLDKK